MPGATTTACERIKNEGATPQQQTKPHQRINHDGSNAPFLVYGRFMLAIWMMWIIYSTQYSVSECQTENKSNGTYYNANPNSNYSNTHLSTGDLTVPVKCGIKKQPVRTDQKLSPTK